MKKTNSRITRKRASTAACAATPQAPRTPLYAMTPEEVRAWIQATRSALEQKQARERAYLDRRAHRGIQTPTDDAYEQDQQLEDALLAMLDEMEASL